MRSEAGAGHQAIWREPARGGMPDPSFYSLSGMEQVQAILRGKVPFPPIAHLTGLTMTQVGPGSATATITATPWLNNGDDTLDVNIALQETLTMAVLTGAPPAHEVAPATLTVNHLRPCTVSGRSFVVRARVIHSSSRFTVAEALLEDALGRAVAHATTTYVIRPFDPVPPPFAGFAPFEVPVYQTPDPPLRPVEALSLSSSMDQEPALETMTRWARGEFGEFGVASQQLLGWRLVEVGEGREVNALRTTDWLRVPGRPGGVADGVIAFLCSLTLGGSVYTLHQPGFRLKILDYNLTYLRAAPIDGRELVARAEVSRSSEDLNLVTGEIIDADGNLVASGRQTCLSVKRQVGTAGVAAIPERVLATVLFTDIVDSTHRAAELGDAAWGALLAEHHSTIRRQLETWKGKEVKTTGDGFLATFDSPARAVQCARGAREALRPLEIEIRAGLHTGECEVSAGDVSGIAVHVAARVLATATAGEVLVSSTVKDLVAGSGLRFSDRGRHELKGIEGEWALFSLVD